MHRITQWIHAVGVALTFVSGEAGWSFEPQPPMSPPGPERVVITRGSGSFLGIGVQEVDAERVRALNLKEERGVEVTRVQDESPAAKGGIRVGDVVLEYNGDRVEGLEEFMRMVRETPPGREVKLSITRNGAPVYLSMKTGARKTWLGTPSSDASAIEFPEIKFPDMPRPLMTWRSSIVGIEGESLDSQLAEYFGVKAGVLVRSVVPGSPAEKTGLRAGDVIVRIEDTPVASPRDVSATIRAARGRKAVQVHVMRDKRELSFQLPTSDTAAPTYQAMPKSR